MSEKEAIIQKEIKEKCPPSVDAGFIKESIEKSTNYQGHKKVGKTTAYVLKGNSYIGKRTLIIRETSHDLIDYDRAVAFATRAKFLGELLSWLKEKRGYEDGGYCD